MLGYSYLPISCLKVFLLLDKLFEEILFGMNHEVNIDVKVTCKSGQFLTLSKRQKTDLLQYEYRQSMTESERRNTDTVRM